MRSSRQSAVPGKGTALRTLSRLQRQFGRRGLRVVAGAPIAAALTVGALVPMLTQTDVGATALIDMYPAMGTHATYDVIGHVVDFGAYLKGEDAAQAAAHVTGLSPTSLSALLVAQREDDSTRVRVRFAASSDDAAEKGLRAASRVALRQTALRIHDERQQEYDDVRRYFEALLTDFEAWSPQTGPDAAPANVIETRRISAVQKAGRRLEDARLQLMTAQRSFQAVDDIVDSSVVTTARLSSRRAEFQVIAASAVSTWLLVSAVVLLTRSKLSNSRSARWLA